jgi:hypothetical protein
MNIGCDGVSGKLFKNVWVLASGVDEHMWPSFEDDIVELLHRFHKDLLGVELHHIVLLLRVLTNFHLLYWGNSGILAG